VVVLSVMVDGRGLSSSLLLRSQLILLRDRELAGIALALRNCVRQRIDEASHVTTDDGKLPLRAIRLK
jgi:hypothetical protein